jgi:RimJ/RimL family protein N-acetyltransferase
VVKVVVSLIREFPMALLLMAHPYWPLFDIRILTPRLEIRLATDEDLVELGRLAAQGIHDPDQMPFLIPWTDAPSPDMERGLLPWGWYHRAYWKPDDWTFHGVVLADGEIVGLQALESSNFSILRSVRTGSWLGRRFQGSGLGKEMRAVTLHLACDGLGALEARSSAWDGNSASIAVSRSLGYVDGGGSFALCRGVRTRELHLSLACDAWQERRRDDIVLTGLEGCVEMFGAASTTT